MEDIAPAEPASLVNPNFDYLQTELEAFELMISGYVGSIVRAANLIPDDQWNWSFSERTPTAREICEHTYAWLLCDRQQLTVLDRALHQPIPDLPSDRTAMIALLKKEADQWRLLVRSLKPETLLEERELWDGDKRLVRSFLFHAGQSSVYKAGQIWMIAFELGLDGGEPYTAPYPNEMYGFPNTAPWPSPR